MDEKQLVDGATALAEKQSRVIKIEPAEQPQNMLLRVAAYTRVSSDSEDQLNSFAAQNRYYTELISGKAEWRMVDIYADEGITGTSVAKRDDFQRMMADCRRGLIDQILVKSISRFARNTKDCLQNIRELKELGVNVRFEREGIDTVNVSSELITAIYAAFAQKRASPSRVICDGAISAGWRAANSIPVKPRGDFGLTVESSKFANRKQTLSKEFSVSTYPVKILKRSQTT